MNPDNMVTLRSFRGDQTGRLFLPTKTKLHRSLIMNWKTKPEKKLGDTRIVTKFLLFPRSINGETRWLQRASIHQELQTIHCGDEDGSWDVLRWVNKEWVD